MNYLRQVIFEMRHQPLITGLSIIGTAIAVFLIMSDFMISGIDKVNVTPESRRSRILYGYGGEIIGPHGNDSSGSLSLETARELYSGLEGVEVVAFTSADQEQMNIALKGGVPENMIVRSVDENFWKIYDYNFEDGCPFSKEEIEAGLPYAILSRSTAEKYFGKQESYIGRSLMIDNKPFTVTGVVSDINPLMEQTYADAFLSHIAAGLPKDTWCGTYLGSYTAILLLKAGTDENEVKRQVERRYNTFNKRHESENIRLIYHDQPWNIEQRRSGAGSNGTPDLTYTHRMRFAGYIILLLIPAINLSSMTRSRIRKRVSEIGLRRAFGCSRGRIVSELLVENFIITVFGGIAGLLMSFIFILGFSNYFIGYGDTGWATSIEITMARPTFRMLFSWQIFLILLVFCLLLNLLSAAIPAIRAASMNPAEAITGHNIHK